MCTLSSLSYLHSQHSCSVCPILYRWAVRVVWPVNSPTVALSLCVLIVRSSSALLDRGSLISTLDCQQPVQAAHLAWCSSSKCFLMSFIYTKVCSSNWLGGTSIVPSLASLSAFALPGIPWCLGIHTEVTWLSSLSLSSTSIHSQTKDNVVVVFTSAARAALLSQQMCILLIRFCTPQNSHHFGRKHLGGAAHRYAFPVIMWGSINTCSKTIMYSSSICEPKIQIGVGDVIWLLPILSSWYPYFKWHCQLIFQDCILV
jgi:hypothetical protein